MNKPARRRQNRHKTDTNSADLSIQTDLDHDIEEDQTANIVATSYTAIRLDHSTRGSSSSSADNGEPQTPSPQSVEAFAVTTDDDGASNNIHEKPMDPHFADLLSRLSMSSLKSQTTDKDEPNSDHLTPTPAHKILKRLPISDEKLPERQEPSSAPNVCAVNGTLASIVSNNSSVSTLSLSSSSNPPSAAPSDNAGSPSHAAKKHMKHLALLESVANESTQRTSPGPSPALPVVGPPNFSNLRPPIHPGSSASVPPIPPSMMQSRHFVTMHPMHIPNGYMPPLPSQQGGPGMEDPFIIRPPSQQVMPSSPTRRMSLHQGNLLNAILGTQNSSIPPVPPLPQRFPGPFVLQPHVSQPPVPFQIHQSPPRPGLHSSQPMRIVPPPPNAFHLNPGPLTAPLILPPNVSQPPPPPMPVPLLGVPHFNSHPHTPVNASNRAQLLSLLNANNNAGP